MRIPKATRDSMLALWLCFILGLVLGCGPRSPHRAPNLLLITLDTTRADHLGLYGYRRPTSPNLDALGSESTVYENAYSTSSWTLPAHASLFTGRYPTSHGARHDPKGGLVLAREIDAPETIRARALAPGERTLAGILAEHGYATGAVVGGPWMIRTFGLASGFQFYDDDGIRDARGRRAGTISDRARRWLETTPEPFFLFLNYFDPHLPYAPPKSYARTFLPPGVAPNPLARAQADRLYDAEILYMDYEIGRVLELLRSRELYQRTLIVVTSDHGELFGEQGEWGHERFLWEPLVHVPLIVKPPSPEPGGRRVQHRVSVVDVLPIILEFLGISSPDGVQGELPPAANRPLLAEVSPMSARGRTGHWRARWEGRFKYLANDQGERQLFDLERDPAELHDLTEQRPDLARRAAEALEKDFAALPPPGSMDAPVEVDSELLEALRALGYVESGSESRSQTRIKASE